MLAFFFRMRKLAPTFHYTPVLLERIVAKLQYIARKNTSLDIYSQIVLYVNQYYGIVPKSQLDSNTDRDVV